MSGYEYVDLWGNPTGLEKLAPPAVAESATSTEAAEKIRPLVNGLQQQILELLESTGPATDEDMQVNLQMNPNTQRPRRRELEKMGLVVPVGEHKTRSGRKAVLWGLAPGADTASIAS